MEARRTRRRGGPCRGCHGDLMGRAFALSHPHREDNAACLPACLSTDVATNRRDIRSSGNKANVHACAKVYETDPVFESRDYEPTSQPRPVPLTRISFIAAYLGNYCVNDVRKVLRRLLQFSCR